MRSATGFTLIEVMITVAIVAILAAVAIPSYTSYITRSKIQEATTTLLAMRTKMEQYFQDHRLSWRSASAGYSYKGRAALQQTRLTPFISPRSHVSVALLLHRLPVFYSLPSTT